MDIRMHKFSDKVPEPTLRRLPWYLSNVKLMKERGETYVSSTQISKQINIDASQIAKDLSYVNISGRTRVGSGKGAPEYWVAVVKPGRVLFEIAGVPEETAREAMRLAMHKLPIKCKFVKAEKGGEQ